MEKISGVLIFFWKGRERIFYGRTSLAYKRRKSAQTPLLFCSVRMPAALCGAVGFKPTFGRIPHNGVLPLNWTVGMVGILSDTIEDALITYAAISGSLTSEPSLVSVPKVQLPLLRPNSYLGAIKMAKYEKWFNDCSDDIKLCCTHALDKLFKRYGW